MSLNLYYNLSYLYRYGIFDLYHYVHTLKSSGFWSTLDILVLTSLFCLTIICITLRAMETGLINAVL